ncbi:Uncharacterised protein [Mycobacterium tuberculosis]|uniref:Uncharacterized protein n=1 Tax=Mycobacterium tuberculosis TaxID=1773 RepID=A0A0T9E0S6_MYCTX|nr:Uncharacterised protein [Mycobacterium tuberculosis]CKP13883.1 Uncharacterised protein [Mycobacterium tuberculosis]CKR62760.1 Uncharacterised protein [Mycobacterium tuberculosis]CKS76858.1 Uncharacterised protein [Mycobacterium tuberculosis]COW13971.1 Uncharacterised protein [Mycobacterium tuberculosis]
MLKSPLMVSVGVLPTNTVTVATSSCPWNGPRYPARPCTCRLVSSLTFTLKVSVPTKPGSAV